jgi:hypothetical protein
MAEEGKHVAFYSVDRPCEGTFDKSKLALKDVDNVTYHFSKKILLLKDTEITRLVTSEAKDPDYYYSGVQRTYSFGIELKHRQEWRPSGYGLGDIISSISLLPNEELTLEVKTWETSKTQQDSDETLESKNISDVKVETSDAREVLDDYQKKTHHEVDVHASANWGWGSASANYGFSSDVATQHKTLTKQAQDIARKSVNEIASKRSIKIAVSREAGSEEKTTRKIKNINQCRTLNINYYQVVKEYTVELFVDGVNLLLFGPWVYKETWEQYVQAGWNLEGIMIEALAEQALDTNGAYFQAQVLPHVVPRPDAVRFTNEEQARAIYAYEVVPGFVGAKPEGMKQLLAYLFGYLSPASPPPHMARLDIVKESDFLKSRGKGLDTVKPRTEAMLVPLVSFLSTVPLEQFAEKITSVADRIVHDFVDVVQDVGERQDSWTFVIPSNGIFAETTLGLCSGCEDYYEVQRQFDLELKQLEIRKMELENERLRLRNERLAKDGTDHAFSLNGLTKDTTVNITLDTREEEGQSTGLSTSTTKS